MTAEELWRKTGIAADYEALAFGGAPDELADLVKAGVKTATCSALCFYELENEPLPQAGEYSVILNGAGNAVCVIRTVKVYVAPFGEITPEHAYKEGEGDRSLAYWRKVHEEFFTAEFASAGMAFNDNIPLVCEEFELVPIG